MPQLMPLYWSNSIFMILLFLNVLIVVYNYEINQILQFMYENTFKKIYKMCW